MAGVATIRRCDMGGVLAGRRHAVVAGKASRRDRRVVETHIRPARRDMAVVAGVRRRNMGRMFAGSGNAVVAG